VATSKLTPYAATLLDKKLAGETLEQLRAWLQQEGVCVALSTVGDFVAQLLSKREREQLLDRITSGASQVREVEKRFKDNSAPELETIIKIYRVLILQLSTSGQADPELLKLADQLMNTVAQIFSAQTKAAFKEREVTLAERKAEEAKKSEQQKALEFCLEEAKAFPAVLELFKSAFAALKAAKAPAVAS
jgi:DNA-binding phage protein